jgi:diaminopimelate decarboxylase
MIEIKNNQLYIGGIKAEKLAEKFGTPLYVYDFEKVASNLEMLKKALKEAEANVKIYYAMKANSSLALLNFLKDKVDGIDAASPFEVKLALDAGFEEERIVVNCPALKDEELDFILRNRILINADSFSQIEQIGRLTDFYEIGIRVNPLIEIGSHPHVRTGGKYSKFGIIPSKVVEAVKLARKGNLKVIGLHCHAGSNWLAKDIKILQKITNLMSKLANKIKKLTELKYLDFGGGLGIPSLPGERGFALNELVEYARIIKRSAEKAKVKEVVIEPGRFLVGDAGVLLTRVINVSKNEKPINVVTVDSGFNVFCRPFIYGAYHEIVVCSKAEETPKKKYQIAGNLCESGDVFNVNKKELRKLPPLKEGDLLAILNAGAYGFSMSFQYNLRPRAAEVAVMGGRVKLIRKRESYQDLIRNMLNKK